MSMRKTTFQFSSLILGLMALFALASCTGARSQSTASGGGQEIPPVTNNVVDPKDQKPVKVRTGTGSYSRESVPVGADITYIGTTN